MTLKRYSIVILLLVSNSMLGQVKCAIPDIPIETVEKAPTYPGCEGNNNRALKKCFYQSISSFVRKEFIIPKDTKGSINKVYVHFIIDQNGEIIDIKSRGSNTAIEKEAIRVVQNLPKMQPAQQKGKNVRVIHTLPIIFD